MSVSFLCVLCVLLSQLRNLIFPALRLNQTMLIYFEGQTYPPVPFSGARLEVCNLWEAICQCKEREQKSLSLNEWVYLPLILLIGFLTKYCRAQQRAPLSSIQELLISADKTSSFIVGFQRIVKFLKASGKRWFLFSFFVSSSLCMPKSWQGEALCSVFVGIFPCPSESLFWLCWFSALYLRATTQL